MMTTNEVEFEFKLILNAFIILQSAPAGLNEVIKSRCFLTFEQRATVWVRVQEMNTSPPAPAC